MASTAPDLSGSIILVIEDHADSLQALADVLTMCGARVLRDSPRCCRELVRSRVEVIVVSATQTALAAKQTTRTVPIVMTIPADPVAVGLVASLARPGGNVTGLSFLGTEVAGKQVELLKAAVTRLASVAVIANPMNASHAPRTKEVLAAARILKMPSG